MEPHKPEVISAHDSVRILPGNFAKPVARLFGSGLAAGFVDRNEWLQDHTGHDLVGKDGRM